VKKSIQRIEDCSSKIVPNVSFCIYIDNDNIQNAHKHWLSGWFRDRAIDLTSTMIEQGVRIQLAAFVDYGTLQKQKMRQSNPKNHNYRVLIRINGIFFMQYNFADSYNIGTDPVHANHVVGVEAQNPVAVSNLKTSLEENGTYLYILNARQIAIIYVCEMNEDKSDLSGDSIRYARLSIYFINDGKNMTDKERCSNSDSIAVFPTVSPTTSSLVNENDNEYPPTAPFHDLPEILETAPTASPTIHSLNVSAMTLSPNEISINQTAGKVIEIEGPSSEESDEEKKLMESKAVFIVLMALFLLLLLMTRNRRKNHDVRKAHRSSPKRKDRKLDDDLVQNDTGKSSDNNTTRYSSGEEDSSASDVDCQTPTYATVTSWGQIESSASKVEAYITSPTSANDSFGLTSIDDVKNHTKVNDAIHGYNLSRTRCLIRDDVRKKAISSEEQTSSSAAKQCELLHI
jgi:hypothetical protein